MDDFLKSSTNVSQKCWKSRAKYFFSASTRKSRKQLIFDNTCTPFSMAPEHIQDTTTHQPNILVVVGGERRCVEARVGRIFYFGASATRVWCHLTLILLLLIVAFGSQNGIITLNAFLEVDELGSKGQAISWCDLKEKLQSYGSTERGLT